MIRYNLSKKYGEIEIVQTSAMGTEVHKEDIVWGNCLAVFIYQCKDDEGKEMIQLSGFWDNTQHTEEIMKQNDGKLFPSYIEVKNVKLNMFYKESEILLKIFTKAGYEVTAYYRECEEEQSQGIKQ